MREKCLQTSFFEVLLIYAVNIIINLIYSQIIVLQSIFLKNIITILYKIN